MLALVLTLTASSLPVCALEVEHAHQWVDIERVEPTCDKCGRARQRCEICGEERTYDINCLGHVFPPKWEQAHDFFGNYHVTCARCNKEFTFTDADYPEPETPEKPDYQSIEDLPQSGQGEYNARVSEMKALLNITGPSDPDLDPPCPVYDEDLEPGILLLPT